ncbi:MAG: hydroxymethylglutaryl-CoA lyase [Calditrichaeota bacterium]|nr:hydroxymethylglutaryl-CoA lyase [Calditrichota bacterium]MCB9367099.1 hydroxymethylglutaryl-CoA lyase [Calditrichota bacterium]
MKTRILHEVGLRDGLQMEKQVVPLEVKIRWSEKLIESGVDILQLGSFVHPEKVPQMADTDALFRHFNQAGRKPANVVLSGLVLNEKGLDRGLACGVDMFCMGVSASETHSKKNTGMTVSEATDRIVGAAKAALASGKRVQVSVQSAFGCGFEGAVPVERVLSILEKYFEAGLNAVSLADTAGHALPEQVETLFSKVFKLNPQAECACHLHNTYGLGLANCRAAMNAGVQIFESAIAGLGGCPFTKVAGGNVCTEDLVHYWQRGGVRTDLDLPKLIEAARDMAQHFDRDMPGMVHKSGPVSYAVTL